MRTRAPVRTVVAAMIIALSSHVASDIAQAQAPQPPPSAQPAQAPAAPVPKQPRVPAKPAATPQAATPPAAATPGAATPAAAPAESAEAAPTAEPTPAPAREPTEADRKAARVSYAEGQAHYAEGRYAEALSSFEAAYASVPNPIVRIPIGECLARLGRYEPARQAFELYLQERPDAPDRASVEEKIAEIDAMTGTVAIGSEPTGARILIDGQDTGQVTPAELQLTRGAHKLELTLEGHDTVSEELMVRVGGREELSAPLSLTPPPPPPPPAAPAPQPDVQVAVAEPPTTALWITSIVGAAGLVGGTVLGFMALAERSDFDANPTEASADRGERLALFADVSFGVGAMAIITGAVLYLTADESVDQPPEGGQDGEPGGEAQARRGFQVVPVLGPDRAGIGTRIEF